MTTPFDTPERFWQAFNQGFEPLLEREQLGTMILVLANASFDPSLKTDLQRQISHHYHTLYQRIEAQLLSGEALSESDEDLLVFFKIATIGLDRIADSESRQAGHWEVQFNPLRALRPRRISSTVTDALSLPFDEESFHFNKPFMDKEIFWSGDLEGKSIDLYYNKYPFTQGHGLLVPQRHKENPQLLTEPYHRYLCHLSATLKKTLPGCGFGYNSYGAYASVNHLHFQMFLREQPFPLEADRWSHNGGDHLYPASCQRIDQAAESWRWIEQCQQKRQPYNLLYIGEYCYLLPRTRQGDDQPPSWSSGFSWHEMAGGVITSSRAAYETLETEEIEKLLSKASAKSSIDQGSV